jgi:aminoglycoside phosphotransferase (APT) family kinase protein
MPELPWPRAAVAQAVALAGPRAEVRHISALAGGTHARTYLIQTSNPELDVILREFPAGDPAAGQEAQVLTALDGLGGLAPRLLASSPLLGAACPLLGAAFPDAIGGGTTSAGPWNLISRLPGAADITPARPSAFATALGETLARIHATTQSGLPSVFDRPGGSLNALSGPAASPVAARQHLLTGAPGVLTHYDFWSGNTLWRDGILTGVVDWSGSAIGPRGYDVGWCRLDLYLLYDQRIADCFLDAYQAAAGNALAGSLLWDLWAVARSYQNVESWVPNYHDLGRSDLTAAELRKRHTQWSEYLLGRSASTTF